MGGVEPDRPSSSGRGARLGQYWIVRRIGHGSFGTVYEAVIRGSAGAGRRVAIKKLRAHVVNSEPEFIQSMANEARIGALLNHANVVRVLQFGRRRNHYYLAMDFVDGADLGQLVRACGFHGVGLPRFAVIDFARQIIRGLQHAHGLRDDEGNPTELVHRDIKPSNVLVDRQGIARVGDFGVARSTTNVYVTTLSGVIKGTPRYMSPEQVVGEKPLDRRSDLFSAGAVLYEMITGDYLFDGRTLPSLAHAIMRSDLVPRLAEAEAAMPGCRPVLERLLRRDPDARYPEASEVDRDLMELAKGYPAESSLADVVGRLLPLVDRSGSVEIDDTAALERDLHGVDADEGATVSLENPRADGSTVRHVARTASWDRFNSAVQSPESVSVGSPPAPEGTPGPVAGGGGRRAFARVGIAIAVVLAIVVFAVVGTRLGPCTGAAEQNQEEGG